MFHVKHNVSGKGAFMNQNIPLLTYDNLPLTGDQRVQLDRYAALLEEKNREFNLTAITDPEEVREKHFADSMAASVWKGFPDIVKRGKILDLGTGGGFPGVPIKIAYPDADITLLDATRKKLEAVSEMAANIGISDLKTAWGRAEDLGRDPQHREKYDLVVSRAVAYLPALIECAVPFLKTGGIFLAYKQAGSDSEIEAAGNALHELNAVVEEQIPYQISDGETRRLLVIRKTAATPDRYPRRAGKPIKKPL